LENPNLDGLTPGQRYTLAIVIILAVLMLRIGLPHHTTSPPAVPPPTTTALTR